MKVKLKALLHQKFFRSSVDERQENVSVVILLSEIKHENITEAAIAFLDLMYWIHSWTDTIIETQLHFLIQILFRRKDSYHYFFGNLANFGISAYASF